MSMDNQQHLPPHNRDAEMALLGSILIDPDAYFEVADLVKPDDFYVGKHKSIFKAMVKLSNDSQPIDLVTVPALVEGDDIESYIISLINTVPTSVNAVNYAGIVSECALRCKAIKAAGQVAKLAYSVSGDLDQQMNEAESLILSLRADQSVKGILSPEQYTRSYLDRFLSRCEGVNYGVPTGFYDLDKMLNSLQAPHQYILAARPAMGKSLLALNIADHVVRNGKRVLFFSIEMSENQIMNRRVSALTGIDSRLIDNPSKLNQEQKNKVFEAVEKLEKMPLFLDCSETLTPASVTAKANQHYIKHGLDLIVIDHLHIMQPNKPSSRGGHIELGEMSIELARLGKRLNVPVLTLAQLNRNLENRQVKRPTLADLRESGRIEENAHTIMFVHREHYYDEMEPANEAILIVAKNRDGPTGSIDLHFRPETSQFLNVAKIDLNPPPPTITTTTSRPDAVQNPPTNGKVSSKPYEQAQLLNVPHKPKSTTYDM